MKNTDNEYEFYKNYKPKNDGFEDVFSTTKSNSNMEEVFSSSSHSGKHYAPKKKSKFARWWARRKTWQKTLMIASVSFLTAIAIIIGVFAIVFNYNYNDITEDPDDLGFEDVLDEKIINVALFGIDTRDKNSFKGNSDSIMILSLNKKTKEVKIISVLRDSFVPISYNGKTTYNKINSAYAKGGPELAIKTLNTVFNLDISEYATVNFYGMADIIDAVGGIDAELTSAEVQKFDGTQHGINGCVVEICAKLGIDSKQYYIYEPGVHHLNGIQAVAYSRIRYVANIWGTNNDYGRTDRQRYVMEQLFNKALTLKKTQYPKLAKSLIPCSETSLSYSEIMNLAFSILLHNPTFSQARIPQQEWLMTQPNAGVGSVVYYDIDFASKLIHSFIYDGISFEDYIAKNGVQKNDWYAKRGSSSSAGGSYSHSSSNGGTATQNGETPNSNLQSESQTSSDTNSGGNNSTPQQGNDDGKKEPDEGQKEGTTEKDDDKDSEPDEKEEENPKTESGSDVKEKEQPDIGETN